MRCTPIFKDRAEAGRKLAEVVVQSVLEPQALILALPRGGVPVANEIMSRLRDSELDVYLVRKLGLPGHEELAIGAIASGGMCVLNESLIRELHLAESVVQQVIKQEQAMLNSREEQYRRGWPAIAAGGRTVILVDDGLATGASMKAAARAIWHQNPAKVIVAVPVGSRETCHELREFSDQVICLYTPARFVAVGAWYENFSQTTDEEVYRILKSARMRVR